MMTKLILPSGNGTVAATNARRLMKTKKHFFNENFFNTTTVFLVVGVVMVGGFEGPLDKFGGLLISSADLRPERTT